MFGYDRAKRYQECNILEKIYRRKAYLSIPLAAFKVWTATILSEDPEEFRNCWSLAVGIAQSEMKWYYTSEEVFEKLRSGSAVKPSQARRISKAILNDFSEALERRDARVISEDFEAL